jgi:hypothetical protein
MLPIENYEEYVKNYLSEKLPGGTDLRRSKEQIDFENKYYGEICEINRAYCRLTDEEDRALTLGKTVSVKTESGEVKKLGWIPMRGFAKLGWVE